MTRPKKPVAPKYPALYVHVRPADLDRWCAAAGVKEGRTIHNDKFTAWVVLHLDAVAGQPRLRWLLTYVPVETVETRSAVLFSRVPAARLAAWKEAARRQSRSLASWVEYVLNAAAARK